MRMISVSQKVHSEHPPTLLLAKPDSELKLLLFCTGCPNSGMMPGSDMVCPLCGAALVTFEEAKIRLGGFFNAHRMDFLPIEIRSFPHTWYPKHPLFVKGPSWPVMSVSALFDDLRTRGADNCFEDWRG